MCYLDGPLCSDYAEAWVESAKQQLRDARTYDGKRQAELLIEEAQMDYDLTPRGQAVLQELIVDDNLSAQKRLDRAQARLDEFFKKTGRSNEGDVTEGHIPEEYEDTNPALSIPVPDPIGRMYRRPGVADMLPTGPNKGVILPSDQVIKENVLSGKWLPSITNVIDVRNSPHLIGWAASKAVKAFYAAFSRNPEKVSASPNAAMGYSELAGNRDRDEAAARGTRVHYVCEQVSLGRSVHPSALPANEWKYVNSFRAWMEAFKPEFIGREVTVFGTTPGGDYAGTADFIARIGDKVVAGDYKTTRSGLHLDVAFQLSAVVHATHYTTDGETLLPMMHVDAAVGVLLTPTSYEMRQAVVRGVPWEVFCGLRAAWVPHVLDGEQPDGSNILSSPLTSADEVVAES